MKAFLFKVFYFLAVLKQTPEVHKLIGEDSTFRRIAHEATVKLHTLPEECRENTDCYLSHWCWSPEDNQAIETELKKLCTQPAIRRMINQRLRPCGKFRLYDSLDDAAFLQQLWQDAADGMNYCLHAYMKNEGLRYPAIDSTHYAANSHYYHDLIREMMLIIERRNPQLFFEAGLTIADELLKINGRDEATRYPLDQLNAPAYTKASDTRWNDYPYSAILVLGEGPEDSTVPLSPHGKYRCELAATLYHRHQAPFIIVSGGHVHPKETPWAEAIEMKKYLIAQWNIPAAAVLVDPVARHTTTNFRNGARLMIKAGMPLDRPVIGISGESAVDYIFSQKFTTRCTKELGYQPCKNLQRLDEFSFTFKPVRLCTQINTMDPLDP